MRESNKDALLKEAIRRFPLGTKYRVKEYTTGKHYLEGVVSKTPYWDNNGQEDIISGYNGILWSSKHGWSETVEEPKVETKFEKGKWYNITNGEGAYYVKTTRIDTKSIIGDFIIKAAYHNNGGFYIDNIKSSKLLTDLSEIQQYLPAGHPDKIKQEVKEEVKPNITWKIGDYVVFTEDWCRSKKGDIDKIEKLGDEVIALYLEKEGLAGSPLHKECKLKVFSTLQEAQKFSNELLGKSKTSLNEGNLMESMKYPEYVECISPGKGYTTHTNAKEYGCINYDYNTSLTKGRVYKVLKYIQINSGEWGFVLEFDGRHYLLGEAGAIKSTKEAYEAQFKKDEDYKVGDYVITKGYSSNYDGRILKITRISCNIYCYFKVIDGGYFNEDSNFNKEYILRKALPHEIPVENGVIQYPYTPEESIKLDFEVKWKEPRYIGGVDPISAFNWGIFEQMKKQSPQSRKTPDLIDKTKVKVEIKRTKVKQIKLN